MSTKQASSVTNNFPSGIYGHCVLSNPGRAAVHVQVNMNTALQQLSAMSCNKRVCVLSVHQLSPCIDLRTHKLQSLCII